MDENEAVDALKHLGLTGYEARVFVALQRLGVASASEIAQVTDVPRSQVYGAAEDLDERGFVELQQSNPIQYRPIDLEEARERLRARYERRESSAFDYLERIRSERGDADERQEDVWMVHGRDSVVSRATQLVADADEEVLYGGGADALDDALVAELLAAASSGASVTVVSSDRDVVDRFAPEDDVTARPFPDELVPDEQSRGRILVVDGTTLLLSVRGHADRQGRRAETALWSEETGFATVIIRLLDTWLEERLER